MLVVGTDGVGTVPTYLPLLGFQGYLIVAGWLRVGSILFHTGLVPLFITTHPLDHLAYSPVSRDIGEAEMAHESPESGCLPAGPRIAIIGAGVVGLSCAHQIIKELGDNVEINVIAEGFMNHTTTFGSGGLWEPYQIAG